ncbi:hypothetical protein SERLA73DRAFT_103282 [Serpula lacrymans var. lacrymans S7.3]|uniref:DUF2433 domain-containing protein n=2 Tax=Serpula lacrymans var. lacrymans TaxID=341189 RepID=F8PQ15_SERL3|nr:uncharacterized protein SERLADRAFT_446367 [Serpula lacrymans var. lacrymans S7.9]EGO01480.1 hypothetical protein SERLA73DRAFT_103282 [Serpula lacrymans var. lacrymans S7.3]EGO27141.1 hypothetical protein SERLADRAFT_446367 [Serpula lacrymans var. lacrymans S7.9]
MQPTSRPASTSTRPVASPRPPIQYVNTQTKVLDTVHGRILCIADIRGRLSALNELAREANAKAVIHTGDFGFFESHSLDRINDRTLRHLTMYSPLIPTAQRTHLLAADNTPASIRTTVNVSLLSEFPLLLSGQIKLQVPVYTVWGACEDVSILEKFRAGTYAVDNLHVLDEATTRCLDVGGVKLRLLGLGGALVPHKMFDNGDGAATIAGGQGTMWTTALQIGELVDTAQRVYDPSETRLLVTHASPGREGIIAQLALLLKADLTISAGLHFRYASSYNEFSVQGDFEGFRHKLTVGKDGFDKVWENVKTQVDAVIDDNQRVLLDKALSVLERLPPAPGQAGANATASTEEPAWKNCWNWNLCDAAYGSLVLDIKEGRVSAELKSQGFNYAYRRTATPSTTAPTPKSATTSLPSNPATNPPTKGSTPVASEKPLPPHLAKEVKSSGSTPPPASSGKVTPKETAPSSGQTSVKTNGTPTAPLSEKAEKEKPKRKDKKEKKEKEPVEKKPKEKESQQGAEEKKESPVRPSVETQPQQGPKSDKAATNSKAPAPSSSEPAKAATPDADANSGLKSPATESSAGVRTPTTRRPPRNPWTLFIRMQVLANETELREFFGEAKSGITRVNIPQPMYQNRNQRVAYVEFGDEEAMKAGLEKHAEKLKDAVPEVKQAIDKEDRQDRGGYRGGFRGRGGRGHGFAARGFAAAGLTRGRANGEAPNSAAPDHAKSGGDGA